jgi:hypothetical protein
LTAHVPRPVSVAAACPMAVLGADPLIKGSSI